MPDTTNRELMLGNEAIARGLVENGCMVATSYPGTPASEILPAVADFKRREAVGRLHVQWAVNEKVAFEIAYTASIAGLRSAVAMKQVGLNVASDAFMSAAYLGVKGGFIVVSADDPGPHSSQTEQDSRLYAMSAKIPVLDPGTPEEARDMTGIAFELSEAFEIPVMIRPTTRVCHARQDIAPGQVAHLDRQASFEKNPGRWAATPKFRYRLHNELEKKLAGIAGFAATAPRLLSLNRDCEKAIVVSGVCAAHAIDIVSELGVLDTVAVFQVLQPFPLHTDFMAECLARHSDILVIEETSGVIEMQLRDRNRVKGRLSGHVPATGELLPEIVEGLITDFLGMPRTAVRLPEQAGRRPTLCAGCPHRASFFAIKKAAPKGIFTSDIGCYTLGMNLGAVDTVLCMGAAISQAAGFIQAFEPEKRPPVIATMGDSTFFHAGIPALIDAVVHSVPVLVIILDNRTTAMTGNQPTPASGTDIAGAPVNPVEIERLAAGCGVEYCRVTDPMDIKRFTAEIKEALAWVRENGPAVIVSRYPCLLSRSKEEIREEYQVMMVDETCDGCGFCVSHFECPALILDPENERMSIDNQLCSGCGVCEDVCPKKALRPVDETGSTTTTTD